MLDVSMYGGFGALARGYDCLAFDGPGQGHSLFRRRLFFRPDWEKLITPAVGFALTRPHVDPRRIVLQGISQGGYWAPRAAAFETRAAALIADSGVVNVASCWNRELPEEMMQLLAAGKKAESDRLMSEGLDAPARAVLNFRMRPYALTSFFDAYRAVQQYDLTSFAKNIKCAVLITNPAGEPFWPGQFAELFNLLTCRRELLSSAEADGANVHCEVGAFGLREVRIFDCLDETLEH